MNWWQSLLIALVPAAFTALISAIVSIGVAQKEINSKTRELQEKYNAERKLYINKAVFDSEYSILVELCEKTFTMVSDVVSNLFPIGLKFDPLDTNVRQEYYKKIYNLCETSFTAAHKAINKYACFIPKEWYDKFVEIKTQCAIQLKGFFFVQMACPPDANLDTTQYYHRTESIEKNTEKLIEELRKHIESLTFKEETNNGD